jgi:hypothetical protein
MENTYKNEGYDFFKNFNFALDKFDILIIEDMIEYQYKNIDLVVKPDAVIREKETGKNILLDYKTSKLYNNSYDNKKIDGYLIQTALYSYIIWLAKDLAIDEIWIWFIRNQKIKKFEFTDDLVFEMTNWLETTYQKIQEDREWKANNTKKNKYFCKNICGVRQSCPYLKW